jgi:hypothetical protein
MTSQIRYALLPLATRILFYIPTNRHAVRGKGENISVVRTAHFMLKQVSSLLVFYLEGINISRPFARIKSRILASIKRKIKCLTTGFTLSHK